MYESAHVFLYLSKKLVQLTISKKEKLILHMIFYRDPNPTEDHIFICGFHDCAFMSLYIIGIFLKAVGMFHNAYQTTSLFKPNKL